MKIYYIIFASLVFGVTLLPLATLAIVHQKKLQLNEEIAPEPQPNIARPPKQDEFIEDAVTSGAAAALAGDVSSDVAGYTVPASANPALE